MEGQEDKAATNEFESIEKLYHYTSLDTACKIIATKTLWLTKLSNLNDVKESFRQVYSLDSENFHPWEEVSRHIRQASFCIDYKDSPGFLLHPMWGHYADNGEGVCLVFDKQRLEECFKSQGIWGRNVSYVKDYDPSLTFDKEQYDVNYVRESILIKDNQWMHEQEYKAVGQSKNDEIPKLYFKDCLKWVILYHNSEEGIYNKPIYKILSKLCDKSTKLLAYCHMSIFGGGKLVVLDETNEKSVWKKSKQDRQICELGQQQ